MDSTIGDHVFQIFPGGYNLYEFGWKNSRFFVYWLCTIGVTCRLSTKMEEKRNRLELTFFPSSLWDDNRRL